jgi:hypothetical protein
VRKIELILFLLCLTNYKCVHKEKIDDKLIYSTLNEIILQDSIFAHIVCGNFDLITIPKEIQKEFFPNEEAFIENQLQESKNFKVDTGRLFFYWKRTGAFEKPYIDTSCSTGILYRFSYPIFSKDLQTTVVEITEDCNCMLGGQGHKAVYRRKNGKWIRVKKFDSWIS